MSGGDDTQQAGPKPRPWSLPALDVWHGLDRCLDAGPKGLALVMAGLVAGWWIYVPLHELAHAYACIAAGGTVTELEIDTLYGGALLATIFPFVTAGSEYAGRLTGFDTGGSDLVYLATDLGPFLMTLLPGVWALRRFGTAGAAFAFGASLPFGLAPFLSLTGDAFEIGGLAVVQLGAFAAQELRPALISDDVFRWWGEAPDLAPEGALGTVRVGGLLAFSIGLLWTFATYWLAHVLALTLGQGPVPAPQRAAGGTSTHATNSNGADP
ncbi:MAG: hypothetical protein AAGD06_06555 [Acidobacteriota bacterium]